MQDDSPVIPSTEQDNYAGRFADGNSATMHDVRLGLTGDGISIVMVNGEELVLWPYDFVRLVDSPIADRPFRLRLTDGSMARLEITDHTALDELRRLAPAIGRTGARDPAQWRRAAFWTGGLAAVFGGGWVALLLSAPLIAALMPMSMEERIGRTAIEQISVMFGGWKGSEALTCDNAPGLDALETLTGRLKAVDDSPYTFKVRVFDIAIPNAFAAPGGYIVIFRGLLDIAESPDEVAGVLGHEMGHVTHRHSTTNLVRAVGAQALIIPLITGGTMVSDLLGELGQMALQASYSRDAEREADLAAVEMLTQAGIRADSFTNLLLRIEKQYGPSEHDEDGDGDVAMDDAENNGTSFSLPDLLASHPATPERAAMVAEAAKAGGGPGLTDEEWQALRSICAKAKTDD